MRKCAVIATCLVNSGFMKKIEDAEIAVEKIFRNEFPDSSFVDWNDEMNDRAAQSVIRSVSRASSINVRKFIQDLDSERCV